MFKYYALYSIAVVLGLVIGTLLPDHSQSPLE